MRRKFSLNVLTSRNDEPAPKTPSSAAYWPTPTPTSEDSGVLELDSPYICRRRLDPRTEQELRVACAVILRNFKPSDAGFADADPRLDFSGPHKPHRSLPPQPRTHSKPAPSDPQRGPSSKQKRVKSPPQSAAAVRTDVDSDDGHSFGTPHTASTDNHLNGSTAPTSVAVISGKSSHRTSHQYETAAAVADAQAAEWMRQQLGKNRRQQAQQTRPQTSHRPPTRAASIKVGIKEYIFPGSTGLSRTRSRDSMRTIDSQSSTQPKQSGSSSASHGWRSWGLQRHTSSRTSRSSSRPGTSSGRNERSEPDRKPDLNLNRELPPLPSLDTWADEPKPKPPKAQPQGAHIATVMRSQDQQQQYAAAVRRHHRKSGSDSIASRHAQPPPRSHSAVQTPLRSPTHHLASTSPSALSPDHDHITSAISPTHHDHITSAISPTRPPDDPSTPAMQRSKSVYLPRATHSFDARSPAPNFSRKISSDMPASARPLTISPPPRADPHGSSSSSAAAAARDVPSKSSKLRRVLSGWVLRKEKRDDWAPKGERRGAKSGAMGQELPALGPVVRY